MSYFGHNSIGASQKERALRGSGKGRIKAYESALEGGGSEDPSSRTLFQKFFLIIAVFPFYSCELLYLFEIISLRDKLGRLCRIIF